MNASVRRWGDVSVFGLCVVLLVAIGIGCERSGGEATQAEQPKSRTSEKSDTPTEPEDESDPRPPERPQENDEAAAIPGGTAPRTFEFTYEMTLEPGDGSEVDIFLPLATDAPHQKILERRIEAPIEGDVRTEEVYGNEFWHGTLEQLPDEPKTFRVVHDLRREVFRREDLETRAAGDYASSVRDDYDLFLQANERVPGMRKAFTVAEALGRVGM